MGIIASLLFLYNYYIRNKTYTYSPVYKALPMDSPFFIETNDAAGLLEELDGNKIWQSLQSFPGIRHADSSMSVIDSLIRADEDLGSFLDGREMIISFHITGKEDISYLYLIALDEARQNDYIENFFEERVAKNANMSKRAYDDDEITEITFQNGEKLYYALADGLLIISRLGIQVEDALMQLKNDKNLAMDADFKQIKATAGENVEANFFINHKTVPVLLKALLADPWKEKCDIVSQLAGWSQLDMNVQQDALLFAGFISARDSAGLLLSAFKNQKPVATDMGEVLPSNTSTFLHIGLSDFYQYRQDYEEYLRAHNQLADYKQNTDRLKQKLGSDIEAILWEHADCEMALLYTDINRLDAEENIYFVLRVKSQSAARSDMEEMLLGWAKKEEKDVNKYISAYKLDEATRQTIYMSPEDFLPKQVFGSLFENVRGGFYTFIGNYLVFGHSVRSLGKLAHFHLLNKTLSKDVYYQEFAHNIEPETNFYLYTNIARSPELYAGFLRTEAKKMMNQKISTLRLFQSASYQILSDAGKLLSIAYLKYNPVYKEGPRTLWERPLEANSHMKPALVTNHYNQGKEIFVQDEANNVYLINGKSGRILWHKELDSQIKSEVYQVDYYDNGKLQMLFSTHKRIYLIDRLGNNVEDYPIKLPAPATNGISLFDYNKDGKDMRLFVACEDKQIYLYDLEGKRVMGWDFKGSERPVYNDIQHYRVGDKDYIVFFDSLRTYILDRRGQVRTTVKENYPRSRHNNFTGEHTDEPGKARLVQTDLAGNVRKTDFESGEIETIKLSGISPGHFFLFEDIDRDGRKDYIILDNKELKVIDQEKKSIYSFVFKSPITEAPVTYSFSGGENKIGVCDPAYNEIYLLNSDGSLYKGFPLKGKGRFTIGRLYPDRSYFNLFVAGENKFLYNYEVD